MINLQSLIDDAKCYETVRQLRWPEGVRCPRCNAVQVTQQGHDTTQPARQKYHCATCKRYFDDLTDTVFAGHHQPLRVWILCSYFMGLNLSPLCQDSWCAVQRHGLSAGANPARQLSLQPEATGAVVEVTKRLKPLV
jgi:transposase-like protein